MNLIYRIYAALLHLYPREFRDEFGDEMEAVFAGEITDARERGRGAVLALVLRELRNLPGAILREHCRARRRSIMENNPRSSRLDLLFATIPFLLYLGVPMVASLGLGWAAGTILSLSLLGALFALMIASLSGGIPRWALPAFGLLLAVLNYVQFGMLGVLFVLVTATPPLFLRDVFGSGLAYIGLLELTPLIILVTASVKSWHPFYHRIRKDWMLLPFALYGIMPVVMWARFDEYAGDTPYVIGIGLTLVASLWIYMKSARLSRKLLALGIGITLAMAIEATGKWILIPGQPWVDDIEQAIQGEVTATISTWLSVMVVVLFPALLGLLPQDKQAIPATL